jgi:8-oxo-dGTP pyrophosphatase MutT (NUDIX family)
MRIVKKITDLRWLNIFEVCDPENNVRGYQYVERLGVDSVAFICYDPDLKLFLLNEEYKPPVNKFVLGAFGGSIDKKMSPSEIVTHEVEEEAGFAITKAIILMGKVLVSTQMNQYCHLFLVIVDKNDETDRKPENAVEAMAKTKWVHGHDIPALEDWKAIAIFSKAMHNGVR